ncbi:unnamed protein product [Polarella glacialis]|uniref:Uroporphyrinogen decarboxylase (URO-D) domain-containing protein n=1 Tax=Polarella glacialis TaxID=89957 RepID=A0A813LBZ5_POLGL|nr:unnamed protein product [Polarella glacialis]
MASPVAFVVSAAGPAVLPVLPLTAPAPGTRQLRGVPAQADGLHRRNTFAGVVGAVLGATVAGLQRRRRPTTAAAPLGRAAVISLQSEASDSSLCRVARGESLASNQHAPIWLFRQAGRHLPEYNEYKKTTGKNFLELLKDPADVAECTMQPLRRYKVDAAILFSDILVVAEALGISVVMPGGKGILVPEPLESPADLARLPSLAEAATPEFIETRLAHVLAAVRFILKQMSSEGFGDTPLIGFSAAPWTLFFYMVGGSSKKRTDAGERWLKEHEAASAELLSLLSKVIIEYLSAQARNGCQVLQVFEAMGDKISPENFEKWALPAMQEIAQELRRRHPDVPLMVFPRGACYALPALQSAGYDVVTADSGTDLAAAAASLRAEAARTGGRVASLQGNFHPKWLRPSQGSTAEDVRREARAMLAKLGADGPGLIANLGEGLDGTEDPELVAVLVDTIHTFVG